VDSFRNGETIAKEADFDFIARILAHLDPSLISLGLSSTALEQRRDAAMRSVIDLSSINASLHIQHTSPAVQAYSARYFPVLIEHWPGIIQWLEFLVAHTQATVPGGTESMMHLCCDILDTIVASSTDNVYKEELATRQCTIDLIYLLLRQKERRSPHKYYYIPPLQASPGQGRCKIVKLFQTALHTESGWKAMEERLASVNRRTRDAIAHSLVVRAEEMVVRDPSFTIGVLDTLHSLVWAVSRISSNACIWNALKRAHFLSSFAHSLSILSEQADRSEIANQQCWASIGKSAAMFTFCANRGSAITELMEDGSYISCVSRCVQHHSTPTEVLLGLDNVIPYFYLFKAYMSADARGEVSLLTKPRKFATEKATKIYNEYAKFLDCVRATHGGKRRQGVDMCSNMKVRLWLCPLVLTSVIEFRFVLAALVDSSQLAEK
jgi:hypothetical protein